MNFRNLKNDMNDRQTKDLEILGQTRWAFSRLCSPSS